MDLTDRVSEVIETLRSYKYLHEVDEAQELYELLTVSFSLSDTLNWRLAELRTDARTRRKNLEELFEAAAVVRLQSLLLREAMRAQRLYRQFRFPKHHSFLTA